MTKRELCLKLLRQASLRGVTTSELLYARAGSRFGARLMELRAEGYQITSSRVRDGEYRYVLTGEPRKAPVPVPEAWANESLFEPSHAPQNAAIYDWDDAA